MLYADAAGMVGNENEDYAWPTGAARSLDHLFLSKLDAANAWPSMLQLILNFTQIKSYAQNREET